MHAPNKPFKLGQHLATHDTPTALDYPPTALDKCTDKTTHKMPSDYYYE